MMSGIGVSFIWYCIHSIYIMDIRFCDIYKSRNVRFNIIKCMQLYARLVCLNFAQQKTLRHRSMVEESNAYTFPSISKSVLVRFLRAISIIRYAKSSNICGLQTSFTFERLLLITFLPNPRWYVLLECADIILIKSRRLSRVVSSPNIITSNWFQHVKCFTYLSPWYFMTSLWKYFEEESL